MKSECLQNQIKEVQAKMKALSDELDIMEEEVRFAEDEHYQLVIKLYKLMEME